MSEKRKAYEDILQGHDEGARERERERERGGEREGERGRERERQGEREREREREGERERGPGKNMEAVRQATNDIVYVNVKHIVPESSTVGSCDLIMGHGT